METILDDIRSKRSLKSIDRLRSNILDCAKNFVNNDATFNISTLPTCKDKLTNLMNSFIEISERIEACEKTFTELHTSIDQEDSGITEYYNLDEFTKKFLSKLKELRQPCPNRGKALSDLQKQIQNDEEILVEASQRHIPKDPVTKTDIRVAVKSTVCNHIYDKEGIESYFRQKKTAKRNKIQCPQAGCTNKDMTLEELVPDDETNRLIQSRA